MFQRMDRVFGVAFLDLVELKYPTMPHIIIILIE